MRRCAYCGEPLPEQTGRGRKRRYCCETHRWRQNQDKKEAIRSQRIQGARSVPRPCAVCEAPFIPAPRGSVPETCPVHRNGRPRALAG